MVCCGMRLGGFRVLQILVWVVGGVVWSGIWIASLLGVSGLLLFDLWCALFGLSLCCLGYTVQCICCGGFGCCFGGGWVVRVGCGLLVVYGVLWLVV